MGLWLHGATVGPSDMCNACVLAGEVGALSLTSAPHVPVLAARAARARARARFHVVARRDECRYSARRPLHVMFKGGYNTKDAERV